METNLHEQTRRNMPDWLFVLWAGGTALLSYSLVYALRKPFTAAEFEGLQVAGMDYKIAVSIIQLLGYVSAKLLGIKLISELRPEGRLRFIVGSAALSELSLLAFGLLPMPYNIVALYFNGLSLGCMWGVDLQLFGRTAHHGHSGQHHGSEHGVEFRCGEIAGTLCAPRLACQRVLDAGAYRGLCVSPVVSYGMDDDKVSEAYGRGHRFPFGTCNAGRSSAMGFVQTFHACAYPVVRCQFAADRAA